MDLSQLLDNLGQWIADPSQLFPDGRAASYLLVGGVGLIALLIVAGFAGVLFLGLLNLFSLGRPKDEIVHDGLAIFDIEWQASREPRRAHRERIPAHIRA